MRKSTKGALAGVAAVALLMGGFGTRAAWNAVGNVPGAGLESGGLSLTTDACDPHWVLTTVADVTENYVPGSTLLVPGDLLSRVCHFTVQLSGDGLTAQLDVSAPTLGTGALLSELHATASYVVGGSTVTSSAPVPVSDGEAIDATINVSFPKSGASNGSENITNEVLNDIAVTISQA